MIITEFYRTREDGVDLERKYSDRNVKIEWTENGAQYDEVIEPTGIGRIYTETDIPIGDGDTAEELLQILMGGEV